MSSFSRYIYRFLFIEWHSVERADTWGEWVEAAHEMLALLEKIRDKEGEKE